MSKTLIPQNDRVLVKPIDEGEQMYGNIVIPDMGKEKPEMGEVVSIGPGRTSEFGHYIPVKAKVGDIVEMEAFAVASVCKNSGIECIVLKVISDNANDDAAEDCGTDDDSDPDLSFVV